MDVREVVNVVVLWCEWWRCYCPNVGVIVFLLGLLAKLVLIGKFFYYEYLLLFITILVVIYVCWYHFDQTTWVIRVVISNC